MSRRRTPHPEINFNGRAGSHLTPQGLVAAFRALGLTDDEIRVKLEEMKAREEADRQAGGGGGR